MGGSSSKWFFGAKRIDKFGKSSGRLTGRAERPQLGRFNLVSPMKSLIDGRPVRSSSHFRSSSWFGVGAFFSGECFGFFFSGSSPALLFTLAIVVMFRIGLAEVRKVNRGVRL